MKKFALYASFIVAIFIALFLVSCWPYTYRYKLIIAAEVDGEVVSASSVIEVAMTSQLQLPGNMGPYHFDVYGDAVYLDLGDGRNVVATLRFGPSGKSDFLPFLAPRLFGSDDGLKFWPRHTGTNEARSLGAENIPVLVTFGDPRDPHTLLVVSPDQFPEFFGPDVRFLKAEIQMTRQPVTRTIDTFLPWVGDYEAEKIAAIQMREPTGHGPSGPSTVFRRK
jgi:hypothetical protein